MPFSKKNQTRDKTNKAELTPLNKLQKTLINQYENPDLSNVKDNIKTVLKYVNLLIKKQQN